jgi:ABC-type antimicrobial peptide transport system permease subunit
VLATAGVYALLSFTVARRTTEIGIRVTLGAHPRRIVLSTFARAAAQVALGVATGSIPAGLLVANLAPEVMVGAGPQTAVTACLAVGGFMAIVTTVAALVPARRVLRIQPTDALKST